MNSDKTILLMDLDPSFMTTMIPEYWLAFACSHSHYVGEVSSRDAVHNVLLETIDC